MNEGTKEERKEGRRNGMNRKTRVPCETIVYLSSTATTKQRGPRPCRVRVRVPVPKLLLPPAPKSSLPSIFPFCDLAASRASGAFINQVVTAEWESVPNGEVVKNVG